MTKVVFLLLKWENYFEMLNSPIQYVTLHAAGVQKQQVKYLRILIDPNGNSFTIVGTLRGPELT